jgi:hypothetical protein
MGHLRQKLITQCTCHRVLTRTHARAHIYTHARTYAQIQRERKTPKERVIGRPGGRRGEARMTIQNPPFTGNAPELLRHVGDASMIWLGKPGIMPPAHTREQGRGKNLVAVTSCRP